MTIIDATALKAWTGIGDSVDDTNINVAVNAANAAVLRHTRRQFVPKVAEAAETARTYRPDDCYQLETDDFWSLTNLVVKTDDDDDGVFETTWTVTTDFVVEPAAASDGISGLAYHRIVAVGDRTFPFSRRRSVQVTAAWGWAAVPAAVTEATLILAQSLFKSKDAPFGVAGFDQFGAVRVRENPTVAALLAPFVVNPTVFG